jgi:hypothetical protein
MDNQVQEAEVISHSPRIQSKPVYLTFPEAIKAVILGKRINKLEWNDKSIYGFLGTDGHLKINLPEKLSDWILNDGDLNGIDWIVLEEAN